MRCSLLFILVATFGVVPVWSQGQTVFSDGFETGDTSAWWAPARVGESGQTTCYDIDGTVIDCSGTGQDGDLRGGVAWPNPRFTENGDGTVTDLLTGHVWLRDSTCFGTEPWANALNHANTLADGMCGLTDGSSAGDWRMPTIMELFSLLDFEYWGPPLSNTAGTAKWTEGDPFFGVSTDYWYLSSTTQASAPIRAWYISFTNGIAHVTEKTATNTVCWPVRGVQ